MKCDYCDLPATQLAGETNGVLVCVDHAAKIERCVVCSRLAPLHGGLCCFHKYDEQPLCIHCASDEDPACEHEWHDRGSSGVVVIPVGSVLCDAFLGSLTCTQPAGHPHGHVYVATTDDVNSPMQPHANRETGDE